MVEAKSEQPDYADVLGRQTDLWGRLDQGWLVLVDQGVEKSGGKCCDAWCCETSGDHFFPGVFKMSKNWVLVPEGPAN